ncbi:hypothetical protein D3C81_895570 [compost metagenome]
MSHQHGELLTEDFIEGLVLIQIPWCTHFLYNIRETTSIYPKNTGRVWATDGVNLQKTFEDALFFAVNMTGNAH